MAEDLEYIKGAELPDAALTWLAEDGTVLPFATGWTFELACAATLAGPVLFTKNTGIVGADTDPNVTIVWLSSEMAALTPGNYVLELRARDALNKDRKFRHMSLAIHPALIA